MENIFDVIFNNNFPIQTYSSVRFFDTNLLKTINTKRSFGNIVIYLQKLESSVSFLSMVHTYTSYACKISFLMALFAGATHLDCTF